MYLLRSEEAGAIKTQMLHRRPMHRRQPIKYFRLREAHIDSRHPPHKTVRHDVIVHPQRGKRLNEQCWVRCHGMGRTLLPAATRASEFPK